MEIIGFIALILVGCIITVQGLGMYYVVYGFSGRHSRPAMVVAIIGITVLYFTAMNAPFTIMVK